MAVEYYLVASGGSGGSYWAACDQSRYGGSRVYSTLAAALTVVNALSIDYTREVVVEIADAFSDTTPFYASILFRHYSVVITTKINGAYGAGYHFGDKSTGYKLTTSYQLRSDQPRTKFDGIHRVCTVSGSVSLYCVAVGVVSNNLVSSNGNIGIKCNSIGSFIYNNFVYSGSIGIQAPMPYAADPGAVYNNLVTGCGTGISTLAGSACSVINNVSILNTTNYSSPPTQNLQTNNAGESGDTYGSNFITVNSSTAGVDFTNPGADDFTPVSTGALINAGIAVPDGYGRDITDSARPNYESATYPDNIWDVGPFEYDHGEGLAPSTVTIAIDGMVEGSNLAIYKASDNSEILSPTTIGASGAYSFDYTYTADVAVNIVVRKATSPVKYFPYKNPATIGSMGLNLTVSQVPDSIA